MTERRRQPKRWDHALTDEDRARLDNDARELGEEMLKDGGHGSEPVETGAAEWTVERRDRVLREVCENLRTVIVDDQPYRNGRPLCDECGVQRGLCVCEPIDDRDPGDGWREDQEDGVKS